MAFKKVPVEMLLEIARFIRFHRRWAHVRVSHAFDQLLLESMADFLRYAQALDDTTVAHLNSMARDLKGYIEISLSRIEREAQVSSINARRTKSLAFLDNNIFIFHYCCGATLCAPSEHGRSGVCPKLVVVTNESGTHTTLGARNVLESGFLAGTDFLVRASSCSFYGIGHGYSRSVGQMMDLGQNSVPAVPQQQQSQISQTSSSFLNQLATTNSFKSKKFYVFMIVNMIVPHAPQDMMIRYNNRFVPIEPEYVRCQPLKQTSDRPHGGNQCEFALDKMGVNAQQPNMEIWAKFTDGNGKYRKLGQQTITHCSPKDSYLFCEKTLEIGPDQIDQLPLMPIDEAAFDAIEADRGRHPETSIDEAAYDAVEADREQRPEMPIDEAALDEIEADHRRHPEMSIDEAAYDAVEANHEQRPEMPIDEAAYDAVEAVREQRPEMPIDEAAYDAVEADHGRRLNDRRPRYPFGPMRKNSN
ncbi:hypothetical protein GPALN_003392 [Globodera pallida]|nr:hypothetical protein GPALN_003392 [Globodera pallida]